MGEIAPPRAQSDRAVMRVFGRALAALLMMSLLVACAPAAPRTSDGATPAPNGSQAGPKRITAAINGEPVTLSLRVSTTQISVPGVNVVEQLLNASLTELTGTGRLQPQLATAVPSLENGLWRMLLDGRMETTWQLLPQARWQDGAPLTADDLVFTTVVDQDRELATGPRAAGYAYVEEVVAVDPHTVRVIWNRPYIDADTMFTTGFASPLPKHLLEEAYRGDKARFVNLPYWTQEFIGTGPFKIKDYVSGSNLTLAAFADYALGRPHIDEMDVRFIPDLNTMVTNVLSGNVQFPMGRGFTLQHALLLRDQWRDGKVDYYFRNWVVLSPQFLNPSPAVVQNLGFRQAIMYGTDRQALIDSMQEGIGEIGHVFVRPSAPEYAEVVNSVVRYEYDPRRAAQLIEGLGYSKGSDGMYRDPGGERLALELRSNGETITEKTIIPTADMWNRLGLTTEPLLVPPQRMADREYVATFPGFRMMRQPNDANMVSRLRSDLTPLPENRFVGSNYSRYTSPELDGLIDRYLSTVPYGERMDVLRQIMRHMSENLNQMGLFHDAEFVFLSNRLQNVGVLQTQIWDVQKWEAKS
jgi:peptide/nickel transport system substrate-binding protein